MRYRNKIRIVRICRRLHPRRKKKQKTNTVASHNGFVANITKEEPNITDECMSATAIVFCSETLHYNLITLKGESMSLNTELEIFQLHTFIEIS